MVIQIIFGSMLKLAVVGFLKAHLPIDLVPSTSTPYLGSRSKIIWISLELIYSNDKHIHWKQWEYNNVSWLSDIAGASTPTHSFVLVKMHLGTLTLIDMIGELSHISQWFSSLICNTKIYFHAWLRHIHSHGKNCTMIFGFEEDYMVLWNQ